MATPVERAAAMKEILAYTDQDVVLVTESMGVLIGKVGMLMNDVGERLLKDRAEEVFFNDDPDRARAFGDQLTNFVMRSTAGNFTEEYCEFVAGMPDLVSPRPPLSVFPAVLAVFGGWIARTLAGHIKGDPEKLSAMMGAWQKLLAINLDLLISSYGE